MIQKNSFVLRNEIRVDPMDAGFDVGGSSISRALNHTGLFLKSSGNVPV